MISRSTFTTAAVALVAGFVGALLYTRLAPVPSVIAQVPPVITARQFSVVDSNGMPRANFGVGGPGDQTVSLAMFSGTGNRMQRLVLWVSDANPMGAMAFTSLSGNLHLEAAEGRQPFIQIHDNATRMQNTLTPVSAGTAAFPAGLAYLQKLPPMPVIVDPFAAPPGRSPSSGAVDLGTLQQGVLNLHGRVTEVEKRLNMIR